MMGGALRESGRRFLELCRSFLGADSTSTLRSAPTMTVQNLRLHSCESYTKCTPAVGILPIDQGDRQQDYSRDMKGPPSDFSDALLAGNHKQMLRNPSVPLSSTLSVSWHSLNHKRHGDGSSPPPPPLQHMVTSLLHSNAYHTSHSLRELDVVKYLSANRTEIAKDQEQTIFHKAEVVEFSKDGAVLETEILLEDLKLHPRDMLLFTNTYYSPQRAVIAIRDGMILFRTELVRSIIFAHKAYLFPCRRKRETVEVAQTLYSGIAGFNSSNTPFEVKVLEALLAETTRFFDSRSRRLSVVAATVAGDINQSLNSKSPGVGDLQRLIPIQNKLGEMYQDVKETIEDIADLMNSTESLASACLSERKAQRVWSWDKSSTHSGFTSGMQKLASVLERYEYQLRAVEGVLKEIEGRLDNAKVVWQMQLDSMRNRIINVNLAISLSSFALMVASAPAAFFGMNVPHGLEDNPHAFFGVLAGSVCVSGAVFWGTLGYFFLWPRRQEQQKMRDMQSLHDLLMYHIDDMDDILAALRGWQGRISKEDFYKLVKSRSSHKNNVMSPHEIGLLYRMFDTNRVAFLQLSELVRTQTAHTTAPLDPTDLKYPADDVQ